MCVVLFKCPRRDFGGPFVHAPSSLRTADAVDRGARYTRGPFRLWTAFFLDSRTSLPSLRCRSVFVFVVAFMGVFLSGSASSLAYGWMGEGRGWKRGGGCRITPPQVYMVGYVDGISRRFLRIGGGCGGCVGGAAAPQAAATRARVEAD